MYRILKYPMGYEKDKAYAFCPDGKMIRADWVDDGEYKGFWVWVVVDMDNMVFEKRYIPDKILNKKDKEFEDYAEIRQLGVLEEQTIQFPGYKYPSFDGIEVKDGMIYLLVNWIDLGQKNSTIYKIVGYKTGQRFDIHPDNLSYIGVAKLIIKNEIAIYFFEVME